MLECLKISEEQAKTRSFDAIELLGDKKWFHWGWEGMFNINLLNNLRFYPTIPIEDMLFGILICTKAKQIKILNKQLLIYRVRSYSTCGRDMAKNSPLLAYPPNLTDIAFEFGNRITYRYYYFDYSSVYVCLGLLDFMQTLQDNALRDRIKLFVIHLADRAFCSARADKDPRRTRELLKPLRPYMQKVRFTTKIGYYTPWLYRILKKIKRNFV
ncbi:glycosyl transferase [Helicobacter sp. 'CLO3_human']|uniref:glycosyl transferase n=1 Tax=Helicobacter sp. 'CLO3_human' TaxID=2020249 RepID=UPI001F2C2EE3|nr:glycosyl transferase [Helicobacter sp. 'CLO3_human']